MSPDTVRTVRAVLRSNQTRARYNKPYSWINSYTLEPEARDRVDSILWVDEATWTIIGSTPVGITTSVCIIHKRRVFKTPSWFLKFLNHYLIVSIV